MKNEELRHLVIDKLLFGRESTALSDDDSFLDKGIIDSTSVLELVHLIETKYGIEIRDEDLIPENLDSINGLARFVERSLHAEEALAAKCAA
jgi:acyl carrier protein